MSLWFIAQVGGIGFELRPEKALLVKAPNSSMAADMALSHAPRLGLPQTLSVRRATEEEAELKDYLAVIGG